MRGLGGGGGGGGGGGAGWTAEAKLGLLLAPEVGLPDGVPLALAGVLLLGQQAGPQPLQAGGEGHLHVHALPCSLASLQDT